MFLLRLYKDLISEGYNVIIGFVIARLYLTLKPNAGVAQW